MSQTVFVKISTEVGSMIFELYQDKAPGTVNNFLAYTDLELFDGSSFFRIVTETHGQTEDPCKIETAQGGLNIDSACLLENIDHEDTKTTGVSHKKGSLSLARYAVGTGNGSFFICLRDEPELNFGGSRQPDGQGFAAFGQLIRGNEVLENIRNRVEDNEYLSKPILINNVSRFE